MIKDEYFILNDGNKIPKIGFGTWQSKDGEEAYNSVLWAIKAGYTHIDTAYVYENEKSVGQAIIDSGVKREDIYLVTKCPATVKTYEGCKAHLEESLANLQTDYVDLYLIHAPWPWSAVGSDCTEGNIEVWKAMIEAQKAGKIKSIGVSNFLQTDIEPLIKATGVKPACNQIRFFIGNTQPALTKYCQDNDILVEAYSPLATGKLLSDETIINMAAKYNTSIPKLCIRYCIEKGTLPLPKSVHENRIIDNLDVNFTISKEDIEVLDKVHNPDLDRPLRS